MESSRGARRLAKILALVAGLGAIVIPLSECIVWAFIARATRLAPEALSADGMSGMILEAAKNWGIAFEPSQITTPALIAGWAISLIGSIPMVIGLWSVRRTFLESAEGRPFSDVSVRSFRRFAWASLIAMIAVIVEKTATGLAISVLSPEIVNTLAIGFGSDDLSRLFGALLLVAVAHVFAEGKRLAEDVEGLL